ncbi:MAG: translation initiation factor eIF-1A [Candidatus Aenigmatarchaeota archaeon]
MVEYEQEQAEIARIRIPKQGEVLGLAVQMLGAGRIRVECEDGLTRICRIPGKMKKRVWIKLGDLVMIAPWKVQSEERADIIWRYTSTQTNWLRKKGYVKNVNF